MKLKKFAVSCIIFVLSETIVLAQSNKAFFLLRGSINIDSAQISLIAVGDGIYTPPNINKRSTTIKQGRFYFQDSLLQPTAFKLRIEKGLKTVYLSSFFIIEPGVQNIECNIDSIKEIPYVNNATTLELKYHFQPLFNIADNQNSLHKFLLEYTKNNPNSNIILWNIIHALPQSSYLPLYDSLYNNISDSLKNTYAGINLANQLRLARATAIGNIFPNIVLLTKENKNIKLLDATQGNKYILIDFWFSHCFPCLNNMNDLKILYDTYRAKGFEIIGISIDDATNIYNWKNVIQERGLRWKNYLDLAGLASSPLSILSFPTYFLLDKESKIIENNISIKDLQYFLAKNLN